MSRSRAPFTHVVWARFVGTSGTSYGWADFPKLYRSERAAKMAAIDLDEMYRFACGHVEHKVTAVGERP